MKIKIPLYLFFAVTFLFAMSKTAYAAVLINELSPVSDSDWIELYTDETIDVSGWTIKSQNTVIYTFPNGTELKTSEPYTVVNLQNALSDSGEVSLVKKNDVYPADSLIYGQANSVCKPSATGSIGRYPDAPNVKDRFSVPSKGSVNSGGTKDPCPSPTPTQEPTKTPTVSPTPTLSVSKTPTPKPSGTSTTVPTQVPENEVLGATSAPSATPIPSITSAKKSTKEIPSSAYIIIGAGLLFVVIAVILFFINKKRYT